MRFVYRTSLIVVIVASFLLLIFGCSPEKEAVRGEALKLAAKDFQPTLVELNNALEQGDLTAAKEMVIVLTEKLNKIKEAPVPERLADDNEKITSQVDALSTSLQEFSSMLSQPEMSGVDSTCLNSFNAMHQNFARLGAMLRAKIPELTAYHDVLHKVWHEYYPNDDIEGIKASIPEFKEKAAAFDNIHWPEFLGDRIPALKEKVTELKQALAEMETTCQGDDAEAIKKATAVMHEKYEKIVRML